MLLLYYGTPLAFHIRILVLVVLVPDHFLIYAFFLNAGPHDHTKVLTNLPSLRPRFHKIKKGTTKDGFSGQLFVFSKVLLFYRGN